MSSRPLSSYRRPRKRCGHSGLTRGQASIKAFSWVPWAWLPVVDGICVLILSALLRSPLALLIHYSSDRFNSPAASLPLPLREQRSSGFTELETVCRWFWPQVRLIRLGLKHEEIAQLIGTSSGIVTRTLTEFKKQRNIELSGSTLVLRNKPALEDLGADWDRVTHP
jgi:Crp-like helix-turn-helix protein